MLPWKRLGMGAVLPGWSPSASRRCRTCQRLVAGRLRRWCRCPACCRGATGFRRATGRRGTGVSAASVCGPGVLPTAGRLCRPAPRLVPSHWAGPHWVRGHWG